MFERCQEGRRRALDRSPEGKQVVAVMEQGPHRGTNFLQRLWIVGWQTSDIDRDVFGGEFPKTVIDLVELRDCCVLFR